MRKRTKQTVKLDDVAALAGVSPSTVSLYVRHPHKVSEKSGSKIRQAIDELGYVHNRIASQFTGGRSHTMAVVVPSIANIIFGRTLQQIEKRISAAGYQLQIASHDHCLEKEEQQIRSMLEWSPAVIAVTGLEHTPNTLKLLKSSGIPVVQMWEVGGDDFPAQVGLDHFKAGFEAARYLYESGCSKVAYFTVRLKDDIRAQKRSAGYLEAVRQFGEHPPIILDMPRSDNTFETSRNFLTRTLVKDRGLDGIIASNDDIGTAVLMESFDKEIEIPRQLSVMGFGDFPLSAHLSPHSLSSVNLNTDRVAEAAAQMMLRLSEEEGYRGEVVDVGYEIIPRGSTRLLI
ncbi:LacI family DNA-binding transcriptional regulator [Dongshaea marina]|uniref:LacI family DNA-binding transcriptional regulator n=1 Tax=Dongshaea marina TaxID=2047966 RepID=UPI000D3EAF29|nr:LacI family DNA-binding transcriptional regulator [Dongshaea marina]